MFRSSRRVVMSGAVVCFFFSGTAGLLYEVVWTRLLGLVFGHTVHAITTVLAAYMGGLALGSLLLGRWADRVARPLRAYALLEALIGAYCAATPWLLRGVDALYVSIDRSWHPSPSLALALQFALAGAVLAIPTTLMGATLPVLSRAVVEVRGVAASRVATLYGVNTWGAVVGTVVTGFLLLPAVGLRTTVWLGVAINAAVAAVALLVERAMVQRGAREQPVLRPSRPEADDRGNRPARTHVALGLAAAGISGAASMAYELAWTRALSLVVGSSTYAFTAMLATFLVGLAVGALLVARVVQDRAPDLATFGKLQLAIALASIALLPAFGWLPYAALWVLGRIGVSYGAAVTVQFALSFAAVIVPTLIIGATFPVMVAALARGVHRLGRDVGLIYGANTIGTILGSVAAGFLLIPAFGMQNTVRIAAATNLAAGAALLLTVATTRRRAALVTAAAAGFALLVVFLPRWDAKVMTSGVAVYAADYLKSGGAAFEASQADRELLLYSEGISTTVAVERTNETVGIRVNGKVDASTGADMPTQLLVGHIGALLHPQPRRAFIVGLASGVTAGALAQHPVEAIDIAELEPAMLPASRFFAKENRNVMQDPRVRLIHGDGRHVLAAATEPYDLIISEPSNPWIAGVASLFTSDFYELARQRLSAEGVFVQWLQGYGIFTRDMQMVVRTFQSVFPHVSVWTAAPGDFLLVATPHELSVDYARMAARVAASPGLRDDFDRFGWADGNILFRFFLDENGARRFAADAPMNTDDLPLLEFRAPMALYARSASQNVAAMRASRTVELPPVSGIDPATLAGPGAHLRAAAAQWRANWPDLAYDELARAGPAEALDGEARLERGRLLLLLDHPDEAIRELDPVASARPGESLARDYLRAAIDLVRDPPRSELRGAVLDRCSEGRGPGYCRLALDQLEPEIRAGLGGVTVANNEAGARYRLGDLAGAEAALRRALALDPTVATTHFNLGLMLEKQRRSKDAAVAYREALRLDPTSAAARQRLAAIGEANGAAPR